MAKNAPYFKFFIDDWTSVPMRLKREEAGDLFNIIIMYWAGECDYSIEDLREDFPATDVLLRKGFLSEDGVPILDELWEQMQERSRKAKQNGKKGGQAKAKNNSSKSLANANQSLTDSLPKAKHLPSDSLASRVEEEKSRVEYSLETNTPLTPQGGEVLGYDDSKKNEIKTNETQSNRLKKTKKKSSGGGSDYSDQFEMMWASLNIRPGSKQKAWTFWKRLSTVERALCRQHISEFYELEEREAKTTNRSETHISTAINSKFWENMEDKRRSANRVNGEMNSKDIASSSKIKELAQQARERHEREQKR